MTTTATALTSDELSSLLEEEGFERWIIGGELREKSKPMTRRSPSHAGAITSLASLLRMWSKAQPTPRPRVFAADIYFRLQAEPETNVGVDIAVATPAQAATVTPNLRFIDGPPMLAAEGLSANDVHEDVHEKLEAYLDAGTPVVWIVDPFDSTVTVYRRGHEPVMFNRSQELAGDPDLPGFRCPVAEIFE